MALEVSTAASIEPVTVAEAKAHMNIAHSDDDTQIGNLIKGATQYAQDWQRRQYINATYKLYLDGFPSEIRVPIPPLSSVTTLAYLDSAGDSQTLTENTDFQVDTKSEPARIRPEVGTSWPATESGRYHTVTLTYVAGYGTSTTDVPENIRLAIMNLVANAYEYREPEVTGTIVARIRTNWEALLGTRRIHKF